MKPIGGILLIIGTAIGAGMLALPMVTAQGGFLLTLPIFTLTWAVMTLGAFYLLEVNLKLPSDSNLISMSGKTCGILGQVIIILFYVCLLYSVVAAYISAGGDLLGFLLSQINLNLPLALTGLIFTTIFATVIYSDIKKLDIFNKLLMTIKCITFITLIAIALPHAHLKLLQQGQLSKTIYPLPTIVASFTFGIIVPSMRQLFNGDLHKLRKVIIWGSIIPLIGYILWDISVQGIIPAAGIHGLSHVAYHSTQPVTSLVSELEKHTGNKSVSIWAQGFTSICVLTSFLGVGLSLVAFLTDGVRCRNEKLRKNIAFLLAFIPPWIVMVFFPKVFTYGIKYAGFCAIILMMLFPGIMAYRSRYHLNMQGPYQVTGGKPLLIIYIIISVIITSYATYHLIQNF